MNVLCYFQKINCYITVTEERKKQWKQSYGRDNCIMRDLWNEKNKSAVYMLIKLLCKQHAILYVSTIYSLFKKKYKYIILFSYIFIKNTGYV